MKTFLKKNSLSSFTFFYRYLFSKRANSVVRKVALTCLFGLMISIGSLLIVFNVMGGLGSAITERFLAEEPHLVVTFDQNKKITKKEIEDVLKTVTNKKKDKNKSTAISGVYFFESVDVVIRSAEGGFSGASAKGYDLDRFKKFFQKDLSLSVEGDIYDEGSSGSATLKESQSDVIPPLVSKPRSGRSEERVTAYNPPRGVVMGLGLAGELDLYEGELIRLIPAENLLLPPGEPISFVSARISKVVSLPNESENSRFLFYDRKHFPSFKKNSSYQSGFEIFLQEPENFLPYKTALEKQNFSVETWSERNSSVFFALKVEKIIMSVFLSLAGLITLLAVSSLLVLLIVQKKKEIGVLMAMGLPAEKAKSLFTGMGLLLCLSGILGALLLSVSVCLLLKYAPIPLLSQFYSQGEFPVEFNFSFMLLLFFGVLLLSILSCVLSVRSQLRYTPSELIKTPKGG